MSNHYNVQVDDVIEYPNNRRRVAVIVRRLSENSVWFSYNSPQGGFDEYQFRKTWAVFNRNVERGRGKIIKGAANEKA